MPLYNYVCQKCGSSGLKLFPYYDANRNLFALPTEIVCECGDSKKHKISLPHLNTRPAHLSDEWRCRLDKTDDHKQRDADNKFYEKRWEEKQHRDVQQQIRINPY